MGMKTTIKSEIFSLLQNHPDSWEFIESLSEIGELLFFGGSIRDYYIYNEYKDMPRDFDIAVKLNPKNEMLFTTFVEQYNFKKNRFGGYKVKIEGIEFDLWNLQNTWAFKEKKLLAEEKNLAKSVFLSVDGIVYNFNQNILYDDDLKWSMDNKQINIVLNDNPQKELNLLRALVFKKKYNFDFSVELKAEYKKLISLNQDFYEKLYELQFSHYKSEYFTRADVIKELQHIG
ncbi:MULTISPECIES: hypothetical protein [Bacillus]|uniref:hypothetical protein n=1 Tax=Bacillus TaxID=1386 RepID=UPI0007786627|nr:MULTISPECIES: hypothetical protein [Bacillus cereus group]KXY42462.1 hypothetical protein AT265_09150 [Bacillus cereus]MDZ4422068.1 hypothetical protein [Bacillus cereus]PEE29875.1 hypothetical protein CON98_11860 [Bacillus toyonensis]